MGIKKFYKKEVKKRQSKNLLKRINVILMIRFFEDLNLK